MKKHIILAVAVLSVLAGLLAVGYAQTRDDGTDTFELRRTLIDRIEDAYTNGDLQTLEALGNHAVAKHSIQDFRDALNETLAIEAKNAELRLTLRDQKPRADDEPEAVVSAFGNPFEWLATALDAICHYNANQQMIGCGLSYNICFNNVYPNGVPATPSRGDLTNPPPGAYEQGQAFQQCQNDLYQCENDAMRQCF